MPRARSVALVALSVLAYATATGRDAAATSARPAETRATSGGAPLRVAVISDLNDSYGSRSYSTEVKAAVEALTLHVRPDVVLITGDMVAGQAPNLPYAAMWASFHRAVTEPLTRAGIAVAPAPGNHDASGYPVFARERAEYARQWREPSRVPNVHFADRTHYPFRYSFEKGGAFFVALDATVPGKLDAEQRQWAERALDGSQRAVKIAYGHLPLHPVAIGRMGEVLSDAALEHSFAARGLDAYLSGHHHAYYPGAAAGFLQVAMPCLGGGPRRLSGTASISKKALVVIEIANGAIQSVDALEAPSFATAIDRQRLPEQIQHGTHRLERDDVAGLLPVRSTRVAGSPPAAR